MSSNAGTMRIWISILLFLTILVGLTAMAAAAGWRDIIDAFLAITPTQIAILLALSLANYALRGLRWHLYVRALDIGLTPLASLRHYLGGFALTVTPGRLGELVRLRWIWRESGRHPQTTGALALADRAADLTAVGILLASSVAISQAGLAGAGSAAIAAVALAFIATRPKLVRFGITMGWKITGLFPRLFAAFRVAARGLVAFSAPRVLIPATLLGLAGWMAEAIGFYLLLGWMGADIGLALATAVFFFSMLTGGATGLPGGIGGAEAAMVATLSLVGVPFAIALPATAIIRVTTLWFAIAMGIGVFALAERRSAHSTKTINEA